MSNANLPCKTTVGPPAAQAARLTAAAGRFGQLPAKQQQAIALILSGCSLTHTAKQAHVSRTTLYTWLADERFLSALESWRTDITKATRARLLALSGVALKAIAAALTAGDAKVALALFKGLGILTPSRPEEPPERHVTIIRRLLDREGKVVEPQEQPGKPRPDDGQGPSPYADSTPTLGEGTASIPPRGDEVAVSKMD